MTNFIIFAIHFKERECELQNRVKELREELLMSKAELARKAGISVITLGRVESGKSCRMATKRKLLQALGFMISDKEKVFKK